MRGRSSLIILVVIGFVVVALGYFVVVNPKKSELNEVRSQIEAEDVRTQQLTADLARLKGLQENAAKLQADLATIRSFVPLRPELANFLFQVQEAANAAGLDFVDILPELPKEPPEGASLAQVRSTIGAAGGYFALQDFVRRLHNLDRAVRIDTMNVSVGSVEGNVRLKMTMTVRIFYELPAGAAPTTGAPTDGSTPVPGATTAPGSTT